MGVIEEEGFKKFLLLGFGGGEDEEGISVINVQDQLLSTTADIMALCLLLENFERSLFSQKASESVR